MSVPTEELELKGHDPTRSEDLDESAVILPEAAGTGNPPAQVLGQARDGGYRPVVSAEKAVTQGSHRGLVFVALSSFFFSIMSLAVQMGSKYFVSSQLMFGRCVVQSFCAICLCRWKQVPVLGPPEIRHWVLFRGMVGAVANFLFYLALTQLAIGDASALFFTSSIFAAVLQYLFFRLPLARAELAAVLVCFGGVLFLCRPEFLFGAQEAGVHELRGDPILSRTSAVVATLMGAIVSACVPIIVTYIGSSAHFFSLTFSFGFCGCIMSTLVLLTGLQTARWPELDASYHAVLLLLGSGVMATLGQCLYNAGMQIEMPALVQMLRQLDIVFAAFIQAFIMREAVSLPSGIGAALVLASTCAIFIRKLI